MNLKRALLLTPILSLSFALPAVGQSVTLANGDWAPYLGENLPNGGPVAHLVSEAFASQGWTVNYNYLPWKRGYNMTESDELDGSIVWSRNEERAEVMKFSDAVVHLDTVVFYDKSRPVDWETPEDLLDLRLGGVIGYDYAYVKAEDGYNTSLIGDPKSNYLKLVANRLDGVMEERLVGLDLAREAGVLDQVGYHPKRIKSNPYYLIVGKSNPRVDEILSVFNAGLKDLQESGRYDEILSVD